MNKHIKKYLAVGFAFVIFSFVSYFFSLPIKEVDEVFLTISTFLFAVFAGFFISTQGTRYSNIRDVLSKFDGNLSFIYRSSRHFGKDAQIKVGEILQAHYTPISENKSWYYPLTHKTTTLTSLHELLEKIAGEKSLPTLQNFSVNNILWSLRDAQQIRKNMVALHQQRIPGFQWALISFLSLILLITLSTISTQYVLPTSILKGAFGAVVLTVLVLLRQLDQLELFEGVIGENSARDVLDIIEGKK